VVEEDRVEHLASRRGETERHVRHAEDGLAARQLVFDQPDAFDRLDARADVVLVAGADREDERVEVLEGALTVRVAGKERRLEVGNSVDVPRRKLHTVRNAGDTDVRFLMEARPARHLEGAMRAMFRVLGLLKPLARIRRGR
jgi:mannose-6-phosphate isomerase-like protein (cupin superfamily)